MCQCGPGHDLPHLHLRGAPENAGGRAAAAVTGCCPTARRAQPSMPAALCAQSWPPLWTLSCVSLADHAVAAQQRKQLPSLAALPAGHEHSLMAGHLDILIAGKYRLGRKLGGGSFGEIFLGTNLQTGEEVGIKLVSVMCNRRRSILFGVQHGSAHRLPVGPRRPAGASECRHGPAQRRHRPASSATDEGASWRCHSGCTAAAGQPARCILAAAAQPLGMPPVGDHTPRRSLSRPATRSCCTSPSSTRSCRAAVRRAQQQQRRAQQQQRARRAHATDAAAAAAVCAAAAAMQAHGRLSPPLLLHAPPPQPASPTCAGMASRASTT